MLNTNKFILGILAFLLVASFASADLSFNQTSFGSSTYNVKQGSSATFSVLLSNTNDTYTVTGISITGASASVSNILNNSNQTVSFTINVASNEALGNKIYQVNATGTLNGSSVTSNNIQVTLNVTQSDDNYIISYLCGNDYTLSNISVGDANDGNDFDDDWRISDDIELTIEDIENRADDDYKFDVSVFFFKGSTDYSSDVVDDTDDLEIENLRIDEDEEENAVFNFIVDGEADGSYDLWVKVDNEDTGCYAKKVESSIGIEKEDGEYTIVSRVTSLSSDASCGSIVDLEVEVTNIGDEDSDLTKVVLVNRELGLNLFKEINDLDSGDSEIISFSFAVPTTAVQKVYSLDLYTEFEYDDDDDIYDEVSDSEYDYTYKLNLIGSDCIDPTRPTISAKLDTDALVGKVMNVTVSIKNNGASTMAALVSLQDYDSWAKLNSATTQTLSIAKGANGTIVLSFVPTKEGQQIFKINVLYNGKTISQDVSVSVAKKTGFLSTVFGENPTSTTYLIAGIIILVVLIVIVLLVKLILSRRRA